ncbi:MAG TPA: hypothetical protein VK255_01545 [Patescibacteria group bacterium]|nr:hypothetical protein [Patescibacteria group bacterium]
MKINSKTVGNFHASVVSSSMEYGQEKVWFLIQNCPMDVMPECLAELALKAHRKVKIEGTYGYWSNDPNAVVREKKSYSQVLISTMFNNGMRDAEYRMRYCAEKIHELWIKEGSKSNSES